MLAFYTQRRKQDLYSFQAVLGIFRYRCDIQWYMYYICTYNLLGTLIKYILQVFNPIHMVQVYQYYTICSLCQNVCACISDCIYLHKTGMKTKLPWRALREGIVICVMCAECSAPSDSRYHTCVGDVGVLQVGRMLAWFHHFVRWEGFHFAH